MRLIITFSIFLLSSKVFYAQTNISGGIYSNTTWSVAQSPYIVTDTLTLFPGITLTINPGVVVKFESEVAFNVRGILNAIGTESDSIIFTSNLTLPNQESWAGLIVNTEIGGVANMKYCRVMYAYRGYEMGSGGTTPLSIQHTVFENNYIALAGFLHHESFAVIDSCNFISNTYAVGHSQISTGNFAITNSLFENNFYGFYRSEKANAINCTICGSEKAIFVERGTFDNCIIVNNNIGVSCSNQHGITLTNSIVAYNDTAIILHSGGLNTFEPNSFYQNMICANRVYNVVHSGTYNENLTNNCWCTVDSSEISSSIYDGYDNVNFGLIDFTPFNNCELAIEESSFCTVDTSPTYVSGISGFSTLRIYPNPVQDFFMVELSKRTRFTLSIIDITGKTIYERTLNEQYHYVESTSFPSGLYIVQVKTKENTHTSKLIRQ